MRSPDNIWKITENLLKPQKACCFPTLPPSPSPSDARQKALFGRQTEKLADLMEHALQAEQLAIDGLALPVLQHVLLGPPELVHQGWAAHAPAF